MPKTYKRRTRRSASVFTRRRSRRKQRPLMPTILALIVSGLLLLLFLNSIANNTPQEDTTIPDGNYDVVAPPSITAHFIDTVLNYYHSPAAGKGEALYQDGLKYGIDPAFALAFFMQESNLGTEGVATVTHSLGNIRVEAGQPSYDGYRLYTSWEDGFEDWYRLIAQQYVQQWGLHTVEQIIPVYAPNSDNNNEQQYIHTVEYFVHTWRSGSVVV